jgi:hypothetical protein
MVVEEKNVDSYWNETNTSGSRVHSLDYEDIYFPDRYLDSHNLVDSDID